MKLTAALAIAAATLTPVSAFWRMDCHARTGLARLDPIVETGEVGSHAHAIHGGSKFSMSATSKDLMSSNCTTCRATQDKSAYWTPSMLFTYTNGTTVLVPQVGGMLAYYQLYTDNITAFPEGFQMLAGDTRLRNFTGPVPDSPRSSWGANDTTQFALGQKAIGFNCLDEIPGTTRAAEPTAYRHFLPTKEFMDANCPSGIRAELYFPSCWNGSTTASDHKSHMAYPDSINNGVCPDTHPIRTPAMLYETIWNTYAFKDEDGYFVLANGDPTGYGYHGDFIFGWESEEFLQSAVDTCTNPSGNLEDCPLFDLVDPESDYIQQCTFEVPEVLMNDDCEGPANGICGNVPVQYGPGYASKIEPGWTGGASGGYAPPATSTAVMSSSVAAVPTLSSPTTPVTEPWATVQAISSAMSSAESSAYVAAPVPSSSSSSAAAVAAEASSVAYAAPAPAAVTSSSVIPTVVTTAAAVTSAPGVAPEGIVSTSTYTSAGTVYQVVIYVTDVIDYVTEVVNAPVVTDVVTQTAYAKPRPRHLYHRRQHEHGLLGRHH